MATYRILALDDMEERHKAFRWWFKDHTLDEATTAPIAINLLENFDYDLVMLDHDLAEEHYLKYSEGLTEEAACDRCKHEKSLHYRYRPDGTRGLCAKCECEAYVPAADEYEPGTGQDVARHIASMPAERRPKLVVIHSWNPGGRAAMARILEDAGVKYAIKQFDPRGPVRFT